MIDFDLVVAVVLFFIVWFIGPVVFIGWLFNEYHAVKRRNANK